MKLRCKFMATEEEIRARIRHMVEEVNIKDPLLREAIRDKGVIPEVEEKVQMSFGLRDLVQSLPERFRKEVMVAGRMYTPTRKERIWWDIQDRVRAFSNRILGRQNFDLQHEPQPPILEPWLESIRSEDFVGVSEADMQQSQSKTIDVLRRIFEKSGIKWPGDITRNN